MPKQNETKDISGIGKKTSNKNSLPKGNNYLLAIAINDYAHAPKLANCLKDADDFIDQLTTRYQFSNDYVFRLYDEDATSENIYNQFKTLSETIGEDDNLIIYFSGHGYFDQSDKSGHLVPVDAEKDSVWDYISNANLLSRLRAIKSFHTLLIIDSCFSGSLFSTKSIDSSALADEVGRYPSRWGLAAGRIEEVEDGFHGENSPFSKALLSFLKTNNSAKFPVSDLIQYVKKATPHNSNQTPIGGPLFKAGDLDGEFIFELKRNEVAENVPAGKVPEQIKSDRSESLDDKTQLDDLGKRLISKFFALSKTIKFLIVSLIIGGTYLGLYINAKASFDDSQSDKVKSTKDKAYEKAQDEKSFEAYLDYFNKYEAWDSVDYPEIRKDVEIKLKELSSWNDVMEKNTLEAFNKYKEKYSIVEYPTYMKEKLKDLSGTLIDKRDNKSYPWVRLRGKKKWMVKNLSYEIIDSSICYMDNVEFCDEYGRLYSRYTAMKACPDGWRLPTAGELKGMTDSYLFARVKEDILKFEDFLDKESIGFSVQFGGSQDYKGKFEGKDRFAELWTSTEGRESHRDFKVYSSISFDMDHQSIEINTGSPKTKFSCRCIQD